MMRLEMQNQNIIQRVENMNWRSSECVDEKRSARVARGTADQVNRERLDEQGLAE